MSVVSNIFSIVDLCCGVLSAIADKVLSDLFDQSIAGVRGIFIVLLKIRGGM